MRPAIVSGSVTGDAPVSYWPVLEIVPELFAKVNSPSFPLFSKVANDGDVQSRPQGFSYKNAFSHFF